ncbi:MAG: iron ABC transporter substrate-binding protein [Thermomicrobiales bacterium]
MSMHRERIRRNWDMATLAEARGLSRRRLLQLVGGGTAGLVVTLDPGRQARALTVDPEASPSGTPFSTGGNVTLYSGRNENLVGELIEQFEAATGIDAEVRYAGTSELAATILDEGDNSPADLFLSQDGGALGALAQEGRLAALPQELLDRVDPRFRSPDGLWVGLSGRARVLVYNTEMLDASELPASVKDLTDPRWNGLVGWAPENASFQSFVTAFRMLEGEDATREWLEQMVANAPNVFEGNSPIVRAVAAGEFPVGLVNHYYLYEIQAEENAALPIANHFFAAGDVGSLVNVAGIGILAGAANADQALTMVDYLLQDEAQTYFAEQTFEYPMIDGVPTAEGLTPLNELQSPAIDLSDLADLEGTLTLLTEVGVL